MSNKTFVCVCVKVLYCSLVAGNAELLALITRDEYARKCHIFRVKENAPV